MNLEAPATVGASRNDLHRARRLLAMTVGFVATLQIVMAWTTFGTDDVFRWIQFADGVAEAGPNGVYELTFETAYNHPPATGYLLILVSEASERGLRVGFTIRLFAIAAGAVTPFLILELARRRVAARTAFAAAVSVAVSPALVAIGGFHANTDPIVVMLVLLSAFLLVDRDAPAWAGVALALAVGVKLAPTVALPTLATVAFVAGPRSFRRFAVAAAATSAILWLPALAVSGGVLVRSVAGYPGGTFSWGITQLSVWGGEAGLGAIRGPGRWLVVAVAAVAPAALAFRRRDRAVEAVALACCAFLVLATGFGIQYLAWAVAPAYLLSFGWATVFNVNASAMVLAVYTGWSGEVPWFVAHAQHFTPVQEALGFAAWSTLVAVVVAGLSRCVRPSSATAVEGTLRA